MRGGTYYKATREDGLDFHSGTILYEVGKTVRPRKSAERYICGPGYLHAADVPTETLIGGRWPCRLFEVTGKPRVGFDNHHPHKGGFRQLKVVKELPAHKVFGPQGEELVEFFEAIRGLDHKQAKKMHAARDAAWDAARYVAWDVARDAALAIVTRDLVGTGGYTQEHHDLLYAPWKKVMG